MQVSHVSFNMEQLITMLIIIIDIIFAPKTSDYWSLLTDSIAVLFIPNKKAQNSCWQRDLQIALQLGQRAVSLLIKEIIGHLGNHQIWMHTLTTYKSPVTLSLFCLYIIIPCDEDQEETKTEKLPKNMS